MFSQKEEVTIQKRLTLSEAWPILSIIGIGLLVALRDEKPSKKKYKRRR